jgi:hypothetical protein
MQPNLIKLEKLVKSKKPILINNKLIKRILGFSDMRDFCEAINSWGYSHDFTYDTKTEDWQRYLRAWFKEEYLN